MEKDETKNETGRRDFLKRAALSVPGALVVIVMGKQVLVNADIGADGAQAAGAEAGLYDPEQHRYIYLIDITKCIGCGACVRACREENDVPELFFRTWIERYMVSSDGEAAVDSPTGGRNGFQPAPGNDEASKAFFVPKICNHCTRTPCVQLCPVGASYQSPDGVVLVDEERCIGCSYCVQACPYGSRFIHPGKHVANKCTWCYHRITKGMLPGCVQACPVGARQFGDEKKLHDHVAEIIATSQVNVLKPELMTEPNCYYTGLSKEVR